MKTLNLTSITLAQAWQNLASDNTNVSDGDTVLIGTKTYTFKGTLTPTEGQVLIGGDADASLLNLIRAINHTGTPNTDYKCAAANTQVTAASSVTAHAFAVTAIARGLDGNDIATTTIASTLTWGGDTLEGGEEFTAAGTVTEETFTRPAQQVTVPDYPEGNLLWSRGVRLSEDALFLMRNGASPVAFSVDEFLAKVAIEVEPSLTWAPKFTLQPVAASLVFAKQTLTSTGVNVSDADTATVGNKTYTFKTALTPTEGQVLIGTDAAASLTNLKAAINHTGAPGTDYSCAAAHTQVRAGTLTATMLQVISLTAGTDGNAYGSTRSAATLTWGSTTLTGGTGGASASFAVAVSSELSTAETYQWQVSTNGTSYTDLVDNVTTILNPQFDTLVLTPTDNGWSGYYYRCVVTNGAGSTTSTAVQLTAT